MHIDYIIIGKRIKLFRTKKKITQEELAFQIGTSASYISNIESGKKKPSLQKLLQISEILGVTINDFIYSPDVLNSLLSKNITELDSCSPSEKQELLVQNLSALIQSFITQ